MSLVATRMSLTHRCTIERDANAGTDDGWGNPEAPDWQTHLYEIPCRAWTTASREPVDSDRTVVLVDQRMILPLGTDVTERDRIASVTNRGQALFAGPVNIEGVVVRDDHLELVLEMIR